MWKRGVVGSFAAVLLVSACSKGTEGPSSVGTSEDAEAAWMDQAAVIVNEDPCAGLETVTLVDTPSGLSEMVSSESFVPDASACGQASAPVTAAHVLAVGASLWK